MSARWFCNHRLHKTHKFNHNVIIRWLPHSIASDSLHKNQLGSLSQSWDETNTTGQTTKQLLSNGQNPTMSSAGWLLLNGVLAPLGRPKSPIVMALNT